jgi:ATP-dependent DNA helicase RecG
MIDEKRLLELMSDLESPSVERTTSVSDTVKFSEAVCAFANDMAGSRKPGFLLIGVDDKTGKPSGITVSDQLLQNLSGLGTDGNILPAPALVAYRVVLAGTGDEVAVVEVQPSDLPPVRYKGLVRIRRGPRKGIANESEERLLAERRTAASLTFDAQPCIGATLDDLALDLFLINYRPLAVDSEVIAENHRSIEQQLASLRFFDLRRGVPTYAGIILFARDPREWLPDNFIQYVRYVGKDMSGDVLAERRIGGDLFSMLRELKDFSNSLSITRPVATSPMQETIVIDYPAPALREFIFNAVMHHSFEAPSFIRILQFDDRLEIQNPGPLYGFANPENFPNQTSYRNPVIAEAMKVLGFVNRYGRGIERAQLALKKNGNPPAEFIFGDTYFGVIVRGKQ